MPYHIDVICANCGKKQEVPQMGAVPSGWIVVRHEGAAKLDTRMNIIQGQPVTESICSWQCLIRYAKDKMQGKGLDT